MKKILVTGGAGNVGGALVEKLVQDKSNYVVIVDDLSTGFISKLPSAEFDNWKFIVKKIEVTFLSQIWTTAVSDVGTNPDIDRLNLIMITVGVQSIPLSFVSMDSTEKEFLNVWIKSGWKLRPKAIRFAKDDDLKAGVQSKEADANQGIVTSPGL